jgi:hypothetical protein
MPIAATIGAPLNLHVVQPRQIRRCEHDERAKERDRESESQKPADRRERDRLDEEPACDVAVRRAERSSNRDLARAPRCPKQQQIADIQTGDQQQQRHRGHERREHRFDVAQDRLREGLHVSAAKVRGRQCALLHGEVFVARRAE